MTETQSLKKQCRICLDDEHPDGIISPCLCSGNSAYVHRECLNNWRAMNKNGRGFKACDICSFEYVIETVNSDLEEEQKLWRKYYFFVTRDLSLIALVIQSIILSFAYFLKQFDLNTQQIPEYFPQLFQGFLGYYLTSVVILLSVIGVITAFIPCITVRGHHMQTFDSFRTDGGKYTFISIVIVVLIVGILVVVFSSVMVIQEILQHHTTKLGLGEEVERYIVKDFQGRREELNRYPNVNIA